jgi:hypothetical protein
MNRTTSMKTMGPGGDMRSRYYLVGAVVLLASLSFPSAVVAQEAAAVCALGALRECGPELGLAVAGSGDAGLCLRGRGV